MSDHDKIRATLLMPPDGTHAAVRHPGAGILGIV
jgi:hypothetical protein